MQKLALSVLVIITLVIGNTYAQFTTPQLDLPRVKLSAGIHVIDTQIATTPTQQAMGLMFRKDMPMNEGMLFVFEQADIKCFWMKNTQLPLTAAFISDEGIIINLADMVPYATDSHCSKKPVRYVLEMNQGWFAKKGVQEGAQLSGSFFERK